MFQDRVQSLLQLWIEAIATVLMEAGMDKETCSAAGKDGVIAIKGALVWLRVEQSCSRG